VGTWAWGNQLLWGYDPARDETLRQCFRRAVALGLHFFDTADSYGTGRFKGRSEILLGQFCSELPPADRDALTVATKLAPFPWRLGRQGFRAPFAASRQRLQGHLDLVQLHWSTARYAPWQEGPLLDGLVDLQLAGEVAAVGVSNLGPVRLRQVHRHLQERGVALRSLQVQMSLLAPQPTQPGGLVDLCRELGIELIAYSPLALGVLTQPPGDPPPWPPGPRGLLYRRLWQGCQPLLLQLERMARERGVSQAAVALNWCRAHGAMPIVGLRRPDQAEAAAAALTWDLGDAELGVLDAASASWAVAMPANPFQSR
jgi:pyridoxine 4-dehydrogenase